MGSDDRLEFQLLGPLEVRRAGAPVGLGGLKQRALLALLLLHANEVVSTDSLVDQLWGEAPPANGPHTVQVFISRLRKVIGGDVLITRAPGYVAAIDPEQLDLARFDALVREAAAERTTGRIERALGQLREALDLWRGAPLADFAYEAFARPHAERLEEQRLAALEERIDLELELGRHGSLVAELEQLTGAQPLRERLHGQLMLALYRSGRQSDALAVYQRLRATLVEIGLEPSAGVQELERMILRQDSTLEVRAATETRLLPGTVTLLFTDVESSARLAQRLGSERYADALAEHRRHLRSVLRCHGGVEVEAHGDALFAVFARASDALAAAVAAQETLVDDSMRVRIGVHTGEPIATDEGYVGADVHQVARIAAAARGGQILVSETTAGLVDADLRNLGLHRLRDLPEPVRLYQLGDGDFPPLGGLDGTSLPVAQTPFLGRTRELAELRELLDQGDLRVLTLTGAGGSGKTRLAHQAAVEADQAHRFERVWWVPLDALRDPELVLPTIAEALGAKGDLAASIGDRQILILLDNFEQVIGAAVKLADLLAECPRARFLVTSRERLHLASEQVFPVPPLVDEEAARFFVARARAANPDFASDGTVSEICSRLDNLPLAIELASARAGVLSPRAILERLEQRLPLLGGRSGDVPERQRTIRATIEWSTELLEEAEQRLFVRLAVFAGGCTAEAAEAVCGADLDALISLVEKSLLRSSGDRLTMLETIREYAAEQLEASAEADELRGSHARYVARVIEQADELRNDPRQAEMLELIAREHDNVRAALTWTIERSDRELALRIVSAAGWFWFVRGHLDEGRSWMKTVLSLKGSERSAVYAVAQMRAGSLADAQGDFAAARDHFEQTLEVRTAMGDQPGVAAALGNIGNIAIHLCDYPAASAAYEQTLAISRAAERLDVVAITLGNLGAVRWHEGAAAEAVTLLEESLELARQLDHTYCTAFVSQTLGGALRDLGDLTGAARALERSVRCFRELGQPAGIAECLQELAGVALAEGDPGAAATRLGAAAAIRRAVGARLPGPDVLRTERFADDARERLGPDGFERAFATGAELELDDAVQYALEAVGATG